MTQPAAPKRAGQAAGSTVIGLVLVLLVWGLSSGTIKLGDLGLGAGTATPATTGQGAAGATEAVAGGGSAVEGTQGTPVSVKGVELTVLDVQHTDSVDGQQPPAGSTFVAYRLSVRNVSSDQQFVGLNNFTVAADGNQQGQVGFVINSAWEPALSISQLPPGNTVSGWLVYTVPKPSSFLLLAYRADFLSGSPDVEWRTSCC